MSESASSSSIVAANNDLIALKDYITAKDATQYNYIPENTLVLDITHSNLKQRHIELRFDLHDTVDTLRDRIYRQTGTFPNHQHLELYDVGLKLFDIPPGQESQRKLGYYHLNHGVTIHVIDLDPYSVSKNGALEDTSLVEKYRMTEEEYNVRRGTLREWSREQKEKDAGFQLSKHAREHGELVEAKRMVKMGMPLPNNFEIDQQGNVVRKQREIPDKDSVAGIDVGMRCQVSPGGRRGLVAFVGEVKDSGYWVGVRFDEPVGKTNGCIKGVRYFDAAEGYGGFVRGKNVEIGDFPELDLMDELDASSSEDEI